MEEPSRLDLELFTSNLKRVEEEYKFWNFKKCISLSEILISELKIYSDVYRILNKAVKFRQLALVEILFDDIKNK